MRDTSSAVRAAAATALGLAGGSKASALLKPLLAHDPSYTVQAAALAALTRADSTHRRTYIRQGLASQSYRDAILNSAIGAAARAADTTFIADLEKLLPTSGFGPAFALGNMAKQGSAHAADVLIAHLNDASSTVRRAVGFALRQFMTPAIKMKLQAAAPTLKYDDAKQAVQAILK